MKKIGIITFHNSYNCGSMLESFAIHKYLLNQNVENEIIDFSNEGQKKLYATSFPNNSIKNIVKNILLLPHYGKIEKNNNKYEQFKNKNFKLSKKYKEDKELEDSNYDLVIAGSDQIWNITIEDSDDAYFLPWAKNSKKVAYAPSFGSKNIVKYTKDIKKYRSYLEDFDALSVREKNGIKWIKELTNRDAELLIDPTLLLDYIEYDNIMDNTNTPSYEYIFFYCPSFQTDICKFVKKLAKKYKLPVITWSTKSYYVKNVKRFGFKLPDYESPAVYLSLIRNARLVLTTSFHGTIFSTIYKKDFITIKNGGMYGEDDRVLTLLEELKLMDRLIPYDFKEDFDYMKNVDYSEYDINLKKLRDKAYKYIKNNVEDYYNETKK